MRKNLIVTVAVALAFLVAAPFYSHAQFSLMGQLRTRTEVRNGFGNLVPEGSKPAVFTSQRTRLAGRIHSHQTGNFSGGAGQRRN